MSYHRLVHLCFLWYGLPQLSVTDLSTKRLTPFVIVVTPSNLDDKNFQIQLNPALKLAVGDGERQKELELGLNLGPLKLSETIRNCS